MILKSFGAVLGVILALVLIFAITLGMLYVSGFFRQTSMDINREVTQHSQQYVETKTSLLLSLMADAEAASTTAGQRGAVVTRFCTEYVMVDFDVPTEIHSYAARNCR